MSDLISRSALIEEVCTYKETGCGSCKFQTCCPEVINIINELPTVEAKPVVHGEWEEYPSPLHRRCSVCKIEYDKLTNQFKGNYCPNCGADMRGEKNEEVN